MKNTIYITAFLVSLITVICVFAYLGREGQFSIYGVNITLITIIPWVYAVFLNFTIANLKALKILLISVSVLGGFGLIAYIESLFLSTDGQSVLVLAFLPAVQLAILVFLTPVLYIFRKQGNA